MLFKRSLLAVSAIAFMAVFSHAEVTYTLHKSANPTADEQDAYKRITTVMDSAVKLYNTYSNLSKFINVYYAPGVPTAEASSNGDLRFGENRSYMVVPTAMHEMAHTLGVGTTSEYAATCVDGVFRDDKVQAKLREMDGPNAELHCDRQHIWPYGLNQASEAKSENDLINHVILVETIYQQLFKVAFYKQGRIKSLGETKKCMGITSSNALELMDCSDTATFVKIFSVGDNPVTYYIQLGSRVVDIPNESTAAGIVASTYGYNGGAHQRYTFDDAGINTPNAFLLKNYKSGLYLQAVGTQVQQNRKVDRDESFIWKIEEAGDTSVVAPDTSDTSKTDTSITRIVRIRDIQLQAAPTRTFDLKGRSVRGQTLGRNRNTHKVLFQK
ncbi:RICIN domain-containing protein [Fibrobacter sp.]